MKQKLLKVMLVLLSIVSGTGAWALEDVDGVYQITSAQDLMDFAAFVNEGGDNLNANAVLTKDIDLGEVLSDAVLWTPIGATSSTTYAGNFDGAGHTINGFDYTAVQQGAGLIGFKNGGEVKDLTVNGKLSSGYTSVGLVGYADGSCKLTNLVSNLNITVDVNGCRAGGIVGQLVRGYISNCTYAGTMDVTDTAGNGNYGGIAGYLWNNAAAVADIQYCIFSGTINKDDSQATCTFGGIAGYCNCAPAVIQNNLSFGTINAVVWGMVTGAIKNYTTYKNNWYVGDMANGSASTKASDGVVNVQSFQATADQVKSGCVCFGMNGDQTDIKWFQTIGEDDVPTTDNTHGQVYASGKNRCDGTASDEVEYTNTPGGEIITPPHTFEDGFCQVCGTVDPDYMTPVDDVFQIGTANQLKWFAAYVNAGNATANALLTADIDLQSEEIPVIGAAPSTPFKGTFDGAGHTISNYLLNATSFALSTGYGFFGNTSGATIENFTIEGQMNCEGTSPGDLGIGTIGWPDGGTLIQDVVSKLNINAFVTTHCGGLVGSLRTATVNRCEYAGIFDAGSSTNGKGGIAGYTSTGVITNCIVSGEIIGTANGYFGGILGYVNNGSAKVQNCLVTGIVENSGCTRLGYLVGALRNIGTYSNNYYVEKSEDTLPVGDGEKKGTDLANNGSIVATAEQLATGEITWKLNGSTYVIPNFRQNLGEDETPTLNSEAGIVYPNNEGYACIGEEKTFEDFLTEFSEYQNDQKSEIVAYQTYIDEYLAKAKSLENTKSYEEFVAAYEPLIAIEKQISNSATLYNKYVAACDEVQAYINQSDLAGKEFDSLERYLNNDVEPGEEFANGSEAYILRTHLLDDATIKAEATSVQNLLQAAIAANYEADSEITDLMQNADMASMAGWTIKGTVTTNNSEPQPTIATSGEYSIAQTMTSVKNGYYLVSVSAEQISANDPMSLYHSGMLNANENSNYIAMPGEDFVKLDDVEDGVNCLLSGDDSQIDQAYVSVDEGYVPVSAQGFAYHAHSGRYVNYVATEVTDGTLNLSISNKGTQLGTADKLFASDWHVVYLGKNDPSGQLATVLENYSKRAQTIVDFQYSDGVDYAQYPNISATLKENLQNAIDKAPTLTTAAQRMQLIQEFSDMFNDVYECRLAYRQLAAEADRVQTLADNLILSNVITENQYDEIVNNVAQEWDNYTEGNYTTEQALAATKNLQTATNILPAKDEDGYYLIAKPTDLCIFSALVTSGELNINARLTADLDMEGIEFSTIGIHNYTAPFGGVFDGQGHTISNLTISGSDGWLGMFSTVTGTVKNFTLNGGSITANSGLQYAGVIGYLNGGTIQNVHSSMNVTAEAAGAVHFGGIVGDARNAAKIIGCSFSGTLDAGDSSDCYGGIVGYTSGMAMDNCLFSGVIKTSEENTGTYIGGLLGYANNTAVEMINNLSIGTVLTTYGAAILGSFRSAVPSGFGTNYYLSTTAAKVFGKDSDMPTVSANCIEVSAEQLASGEIAYKMNGDQTTIWFRQNIGEDAAPVLDETHKQVYATGAFTCEGVAKGEVAYSNTNEAVYDDHNFVDGVCSVCGLDADGKYFIKTVDQLVAFVNKVANGKANNVDAHLGADIDCSEIDWAPIGTSANPYKAVFDGEGHSLTGIKYTATADYAGVFGHLKGGEVKNLKVSGNLDFASYTYGGVVGYVDDNAHVTNVASSVNIIANRAGARIGGIVGQLARGYVDRCSYDGEMNVTDNAGNGNYGGIVGYMWNNAAAVAVVTNNLYTGSITKDATQSTCTFGGIVGYCNCAPAVIQNNLSMGTVEAPVWGMITGAIKNYTTYSNNWYTGELANSTSSTKADDGTVNVESHTASDADLLSGAICYALNTDQSDIAWYQNLGEDNHPVLDDTHKVVKQATDGTYYNGSVTKKGDINSDGIVDGSDIVLLVNVILGTETNEQIIALSNLNGDAVVDGTDLVELVSIATNAMDAKELRLFMKRCRRLLDEE